MFNPLKYVENNFEDKNLSDADLRSFSEDHLVRLTNPDNNPGGIYNTLITDTTTKYTAYYGKITNKAVKKAIAEGTTVTRNNARKGAQDKISNLQDLVKYKFQETSSQYQELYPLGMFEYYQAREGDIGTLFDRFVQAATTHLNADHPLEVTAIDDLVDDFHDAYTARETVVSEVDVLITGKNTDRIALTFQLTKNLLIIGSNNISNPDKFDDYYDPRFLPITHSDNDIILEGIVAPGGTIKNIFNGELPAGAFVQATATDGEFDIYFSETNNGASNSFHATVNNEIKNFAAGQIGYETGLRQFLNLQNNGTTPVTYKVRLYQQ